MAPVARLAVERLRPLGPVAVGDERVSFFAALSEPEGRQMIVIARPIVADKTDYRRTSRAGGPVARRPVVVDVRLDTVVVCTARTVTQTLTTIATSTASTHCNLFQGSTIVGQVPTPCTYDMFCFECKVWNLQRVLGASVNAAGLLVKCGWLGVKLLPMSA